MVTCFINVSNIKDIEKKYRVTNNYPEQEFSIPRVLSVGEDFWGITYFTPTYLTIMRYGYAESEKESKVSLDFFIDDPYEYFIKSRLVSNNYPKRCLVVVDAFLVKNAIQQNFLIHLQNKQRAFGLAATFDYGINLNNGIPYVGFKIFTINSSPDFQKIGITKLPVILTEETANIWIGENFQPYLVVGLFNSDNDRILNGYPIQNNISPGTVTWDQLQPIGERLKPIPQATDGKTIKFQNQVSQAIASENQLKNKVVHLR